MSAFEFMMVLTSIIIALALAEILSGFVRILKGELETWWVHSVYVGAGFIGILQLFWDLYGYSNRGDWLFGDLMIVFVGPCTLLYLAAALIFPTKDGETDLRAHYWRIARPFFGVLIPLMPFYTLTSLRVEHEFFRSVDVYRVSFLLVYVTLFVSRRPFVHKSLALVHVLLLIWFIVSDVLTRSLTN